MTNDNEENELVITVSQTYRPQRLRSLPDNCFHLVKLWVWNIIYKKKKTMLWTHTEKAQRFVIVALTVRALSSNEMGNASVGRRFRDQIEGRRWGMSESRRYRDAVGERNAVLTIEMETERSCRDGFRYWSGHDCLLGVGFESFSPYQTDFRPWK